MPKVFLLEQLFTNYSCNEIIVCLCRLHVFLTHVISHKIIVCLLRCCSSSRSIWQNKWNKYFQIILCICCQIKVDPTKVKYTLFKTKWNIERKRNCYDIITWTLTAKLATFIFKIELQEEQHVVVLTLKTWQKETYQKCTHCNHLGSIVLKV